MSRAPRLDIIRYLSGLLRLRLSAQLLYFCIQHAAPFTCWKTVCNQLLRSCWGQNGGVKTGVAGGRHGVFRADPPRRMGHNPSLGVRGDRGCGRDRQFGSLGRHSAGEKTTTNRPLFSSISKCCACSSHQSRACTLPQRPTQPNHDTYVLTNVSRDTYCFALSIFGVSHVPSRATLN